MSETYTTKKINALDEQTEPNDENLIAIGDATTGKLKRIKVGNFFKKITDALSQLNSNLAPSGLLIFGGSAGITIKGRYNGTMITFFVGGALTSAMAAWSILTISSIDAAVRPVADVYARASDNLYVVIKTTGQVLLYNAGAAIPASSGKEANVTLTYIL